jgi:signal peptidase I
MVAQWVGMLIFVVFGSTMLVQPFVVPSRSMEDSLLVGDYLLVDKLVYAPSGSSSKYLLPYCEVKRGDVIVFRSPINSSQVYIKRAIGLPGDHVQIRGKRLILNGKAVDEPYACHRASTIDSYRDDFPSRPTSAIFGPAHEMLEKHQENGEIIVPPNCIFALGDNRDLSLDSRYWGFTPRANIVGKPLLIYWSYRPSGGQTGIGLRSVLDTLRRFPANTRWGRLLKRLHGYPLS